MVQHFDVDADHRKFALKIDGTTGDMGWISLKIVLNRKIINLDQTEVFVDSHVRGNIPRLNGLDDVRNTVIHLEDLLGTSVEVEFSE